MNDPSRENTDHVVTDFHSHILPGIDDGSRDPDMTRMMLDEMSAQGIGRVVATPHFYSMREDLDRFLERRAAAAEALDDVHDCAKHPKVCLGAEVAYFHGISRVESIARLCTAGTKYLLLEMPFCHWDSDTVNDVAAMEDEIGVKPVLAHVERYRAYRNRAAFSTLLREGVLFQSNASFFINSRTQKRALRMLGSGKIHFLGSDCHNMSDRRPNLGIALGIIADHGIDLDAVRTAEQSVFG